MGIDKLNIEQDSAQILEECFEASGTMDPSASSNSER